MHKIKPLIYGLEDPRTGLIRYVGKSYYGMRRVREHLAPSGLRRDNTYRGKWLKKLKALNMLPVVHIIEQVTADNMSEREIWWIAFARAWGCPLTNLTDGGEGSIGRRVSDETRRKLSEHYQDPVHRAWCSERIKATVSRPEVKEKHRVAIIEAFSTPEYKINQGRAQREAQNRPEVKVRHRAAIIASVNTPEARRKKSEGLRRWLERRHVAG